MQKVEFLWNIQTKAQFEIALITAVVITRHIRVYRCTRREWVSDGIVSRMEWRQQIPHKEQRMLERKRSTRERARALMFPVSIGIPRERAFVRDGGIRRGWIGSAVGGEEMGGNGERASLGGITESVSCSPCPATLLVPARQCSPGR